MDGSPNDCLESQGDDVQRQFIMPKRRPKKYPKLEPIKCEIDVSLEELLQGHIKVVPIEQIVKLIDKEITVIKDFNVKIDPGVEAGTLVTFQQEGNKTSSDIPGDVIFIINDKPHRFFKRINQCDIEYTAHVIHPIDGKSIDIKIPTLELNKELKIISYEPNEIYEGSEKRILGGGLPKIDDNTQRGDLVIRVKLVEDPEVIESVEVEKNGQDSGIRIFNPMKDTKIEQKQSPNDKEDVPVVNKHELGLSLNEVFSGCTKTKTIPIIKINKVDGEITENKEFTIEIRPGVQTGEKITFAQQGDEQSDGSFADVVFVVHDIYNITFQRDGPNIKYIAKISHNLLKNNETILIPTLEGKNLELKLNDKIEQSCQKTFFRNGLPYSSDPKMRGNLFVRFEIVSDQVAKQNAILVKKQETINEETGKPENSTDEKDENVLAKNAKQDQSNELNLELTLREIYTGCVKSEKIPRNLIYEKNETGEITTNITIEPGSFGGTKIYWPQKKNQDLFDEISKRIVFTVVEKDETFTRLGYNVVLTAEVTTYDLFHKRKINIPTLDNDFEKLSLSDEITNAITIKIPNRGFPYNNGENKIGDLLVKFNITNSPVDPPVNHTLSVTLEDIMVGKLQNIKLTKWLLDKNGKQFEVENVFEVWVPPGTESGKQIVHKQESDQNLGSIPADIVFIIDVKEHAIFSRNCADIVYIAKVTQVQLSRGEMLEIPILESKSKTLSLTLEKSFSQNTVKRFENYGLPYPNKQNNRGDMIVRFEIIKEIKDPIIESDIHLTLENILHGFKKQVTITREKFENGQTITEDKDVDIYVQPGTVAGTRYPFKNLGDEKPGIIPSDIVFIARDKKHVNFQRFGCDIKNFQLITQYESLKNVKIEIPTLEKNTYFFYEIKKIDPLIINSFVKKYSGMGLPKLNNPTKRGDLLVYYKIVSNEKKVPLLKINVEISLEEILTGTNKKVEFTTNSIGVSEDEENIIENKIAFIVIKPGLELPDKQVSLRRGNKKPLYSPGDVLFICTEKRHPHFTRDGANLIYTAKINSRQAKLHFLDIPTLDMGIQTKKIENINKDSQIFIPKMGLPYYFDPKNRGNIIINFEIIDDGYSNIKNQILDANTLDTQISPIEINFFVSLKNILKGSKESVKVPITKFASDGTSTIEIKTLSITIRPGEITGKKFLFSDEGNQYVGNPPRDIVCILQDEANEKFKRNGQNIEHVFLIHSREKILNTNVEILTLENDVLSVAVNEENIDNIVIPGYGLPHPDEPASRGELFVRFVEDNFEPSDPTREILLNLTLHEILNGCEKIFNIDVTQKDSNENSEQQVKTVHVKIDPGAETGKRIYFEYKNGEYHQNDRRGDVIFIVQDEYHVVFKRCGVDLVYTQIVTTSQLREAKNCLIINVPTLENDEVELKITENIREDIAYPVENRGLPYPNNPKIRGKILVLLKIIEIKNNLTTWV